MNAQKFITPAMNPDLAEKAVVLLREVDIQPTKQRVAILYALLSQPNYHPSAEILELDVNQGLVHVGTTTIYLSLRTLIEAGLIESFVDRVGKIRYGLALKPHVNQECSTCGIIEDAPMPSLPGISTWKGARAHILVRGLCPTCSKIFSEEQVYKSIPAQYLELQP